MSMREPLVGDYPIPDETHRVAHAAFPKGNRYLGVPTSIEHFPTLRPAACYQIESKRGFWPVGPHYQ